MQLHGITTETLFHDWLTRLHHTCPAAHDGDRMTEQAWKQPGGYCEKILENNEGAFNSK